MMKNVEFVSSCELNWTLKCRINIISLTLNIVTHILYALCQCRGEFRCETQFFNPPLIRAFFFHKLFFCGPFMHIINATRLLLMQNRFFPPRAVVSTFFSAILQTAHNRFRTVVTIPFSEYFIWDGYQWMSDDYFDWKSCIIFCCCILFARCADNIIELCVLRFYHSHANFTLWLAWMWR